MVWWGRHEGLSVEARKRGFFVVSINEGENNLEVC
jgi:hypothetical protein